MMRSLNEISGMALKAARGAGVPLGHCEDIAVAVAYLAATDPVRLTCLLDALQGPHAPARADWADNALQIDAACAAMAGPVAVDALRAGCEKVVLCDLDAPRLVLALFAAQRLCVDHVFNGDDLILRMGAGPLVAIPAAQAVTVPSTLWTALSDLAAQTYVPATAASRLAGAGAGLTDND